LSSAHQTHIFLDSSVVLAHLTEQHRKVLDKLKKDTAKHHLDCAVSNSVIEECEKKMRGLTDFLGDILTDLIKNKVSKQRNINNRSLSEPIDYHDLLAIEQAFFQIYPKRGTILDLKTIETLVVDFFDKESSSEKPLNLIEGLIQLNALILKLISDINTRLDIAIRIRHELAKPLNVAPKQTDVALLEVIGLDSDDAKHIASAIEAQRNGYCTKAVFVTVDYSTILTHQADILNKLQIWCTDPLYAAYHAQT